MDKYKSDIIVLKMNLNTEDNSIINSRVARSEAKKILNGMTEFKKIILDFEGIQFVGQGFCDEMFRVFKLKYPEVELEYINATEDVKYMLNRAMKTYKKFIIENNIF